MCMSVGIYFGSSSEGGKPKPEAIEWNTTFHLNLSWVIPANILITGKGNPRLSSFYKGLVLMGLMIKTGVRPREEKVCPCSCDQTQKPIPPPNYDVRRGMVLWPTDGWGGWFALKSMGIGTHCKKEKKNNNKQRTLKRWGIYKKKSKVGKYLSCLAWQGGVMKLWLLGAGCLY